MLLSDNYFVSIVNWENSRALIGWEQTELNSYVIRENQIESNVTQNLFWILRRLTSSVYLCLDLSIELPTSTEVVHDERHAKSPDRKLPSTIMHVFRILRVCFLCRNFAMWPLAAKFFYETRNVSVNVTSMNETKICLLEQRGICISGGSSSTCEIYKQKQSPKECTWELFSAFVYA